MPRRANPDEIRKVKSYGRQSKNVEDFRDTQTGPKKVWGKTRRVQAENTRGKLDDVVMNNGGMTQDKSIGKVSPSPETVYRNENMNFLRENLGAALGKQIMNRKLDTPKAVQKFQFFKHTITSKKGKK